MFVLMTSRGMVASTSLAPAHAPATVVLQPFFCGAEVATSWRLSSTLLLILRCLRLSDSPKILLKPMQYLCVAAVEVGFSPSFLRGWSDKLGDNNKNRRVTTKYLV